MSGTLQGSFSVLQGEEKVFYPKERHEAEQRSCLQPLRVGGSAASFGLHVHAVTLRTFLSSYR